VGAVTATLGRRARVVAALGLVIIPHVISTSLRSGLVSRKLTLTSQGRLSPLRNLLDCAQCSGWIALIEYRVADASAADQGIGASEVSGYRRNS